jgi:dihydroorotase
MGADAHVLVAELQPGPMQQSDFDKSSIDEENGMRFDLLIKGGEVVDPGTGQRGPLDVAVTRNRIAAVDRDIPAESSFRVIDATEQYILPGLVDMHAHVFRGFGYWGVNADSVGSRTGVTTWLDVGSAGAMTIGGLREFIVDPAIVRIFALINISYLGLVGPDYELVYLDFCDVDICERIANLNRDFVLGVKVRMGASTVGPNGLEPLKRGREAADRLELPLMVHISFGPPPVGDILALLKSGDILTHCFTGLTMKIIDGDGRLLDTAKRARERGVIMDVGHGAGSLSFETTEALLGVGFKPDVISTDIHQLSINGPMYDLPTCLSKFMALGLSLDEVVAAATIRPAEILGLAPEVGSLRPGAFADIALFELDRGSFDFYDINMNVRKGSERLTNTLTLVDGRVLSARSPDPPAPWVSADYVWPDFQADLVDRQRACFSPEVAESVEPKA